jgi:hypothetical protein
VPLFGLSRARHRRPGHTHKPLAAIVALIAATGALLAGDVSVATAHDRSFPTMLRELRQCESGDRYSINTGNGYYGAYQFNLSTWRSVGGSGYPHQNPPHVQDEMATRLYESRGWSPWPSCSRSRGLHATTVERPWAGSPPVGGVDRADGQVGGISVAGWAFDRDTQPGAIEINAHVDYAREFVRLRADQHRPDIAQAHGVGEHHGFSGFVPTSPGWHRVCFYALNQRGGHDTFLGCRDGLVGEAPAGDLERAAGQQGGIEVTGWAFDRDISPAPIELNAHVDYADEFVRLRADQYRPDVAQAHGVGEHHGFSGFVPASLGQHTVCLYALNHHGGQDTFLGCRDVMVTQPRP